MKNKMISKQIKIGQIWQNFIGQTFEVRKIKGNTIYGICRSSQGTPVYGLIPIHKNTLLKIKLSNEIKITRKQEVKHD